MKKYIVIDVVIVFLLSFFLFQGSKNQFQKQDLREYQCYALAFWQGNKNISQLPSFCQFYLQQIPVYMPFHYLPNEYPILTILPFSLGLIRPAFLSYDIAFCFWMIAIATSIYIILRTQVSQSAAIYYGLTLVIAGWSTAAARFDLIPAGITLISILLAQKRKWTLSMIILAIGGCLKIYPFLLFPAFIITLISEHKIKKRIPLICFFVTCFLIIGLSLSLNAERTFSTLTYLKNRPFQIESIWATILWYIQPLSGKEQIVFSYGSLNILSRFSQPLLLFSTIATILGIMTIYVSQMNKKIKFIDSCIFIIFALIITSKVLSPQYLIWVIPLIPLVKKQIKEIRITWLLICVLTMLIFPFAYNNQVNIVFWKPDDVLQIAIAARNILLIYFTIRLFYTQQNLKKTT